MQHTLCVHLVLQHMYPESSEVGTLEGDLWAVTLCQYQDGTEKSTFRNRQESRGISVCYVIISLLTVSPANESFLLLKCQKEIIMDMLVLLEEYSTDKHRNTKMYTNNFGHLEKNVK